MQDIAGHILSKVNQFQATALLYIPDYRYLAEGASAETQKSQDVGQFFKDLATTLNIPYQRVEGFPHYYKNRLQPPVGFANAHMGKGHLNKAGHQLVAQSLAQLIGHHCSAMDLP